MSKGLKALELLGNMTKALSIGCETTLKCFYAKEFSDIEKELKALEIIKEKPQATLWLIQDCDKEMEYEDMIYIFKEDVTQEQFELLKEILL